MKAGDKRILIHKDGIWFSLWPLTTVLTVIVAGIISDMTDLGIIRTGIFSLILTGVAAFYIRMQKTNLTQIKYARVIILASSIIPLILIILHPAPEVFSFWMIGGFLTAVLVEARLGVIIFIGHTLILSVADSIMMEALIRFLVIALLLAILSKSLADISTFIYSAVIILSSNITLAFVLNNFVFNGAATLDYVASLFSVAIVLAATFCLSRVYQRIVRGAGISADAESVGPLGESLGNSIFDTLARAEEESLMAASDESLQIQDEKSSYEALCKEDNELLLWLKSYSEKLYEHCKRVGELSAAAARAVQADELLSMAGGLYHEIGKINGKNYIEEGLKLAQEHAFPSRLVSILKQHNINHDKPTSVEAAVVMLTDNILSTIDYISRQQGNKMTNEQVIDNIFKMRMEKGTFDESGLTIKDFKILKEFYLDEFRQS